MIKLYAFFQSVVAATRESESGQTMAEYAVVLAVITIAILGALGVPRRWHQQRPEQRHLQALSTRRSAPGSAAQGAGARPVYEAPPRRGLRVFRMHIEIAPPCIPRTGDGG